MSNGELLARERRAARVSQSDLATRANIKRATLIDLERGRLGMTAEDYATYLRFIKELARREQPA